jgi:glucose/mannose transport system substrate-binding protein
VTFGIGLAAMSAGQSFAQNATEKVEVIHWFTSASEVAGIKSLAASVARQKAEWVDTAIANGDAAKTAGLNRTVSGNPPGALQLNTGKELDDAYVNGLLRNVDDVAKADNWQGSLPPAIYDAIVRDGHVVAIPINNYAQNRLFYSKAVLSHAGFDAPAKDWDEMFRQMDALKQKGVIPLALGGQSWQERILFNSILAGVGGKDLYVKVWHDNDADALRSDDFRKVAEIFGKLRGYVDPASPNRSWNETALLLSQGKAAYQFMGDWAKGELITDGLQSGKDFGGTFGPGKQVFVWGGDVFVLPTSKDPVLQKAQDDFARGVFDADAQIQANLAWGSIPARVDIDASGFDDIAKAGVKAMKDPSMNVADSNVLATGDQVRSLEDLISEYWATPSIDPAAFVDRWLQEAAMARQ